MSSLRVNEVSLLLGAEIDLQGAFASQPTSRRAAAFDLLAQKALRQLARHPHSGSSFLDSSFRKLVLVPTCYAFFYQVEGRRVMIHAVLDLRQDPESIRRRLAL